MKQFVLQIWDSDLINQALLGFYIENPLFYSLLKYIWARILLFFCSNKYDVDLLEKAGPPFAQKSRTTYYRCSCYDDKIKTKKKKKSQVLLTP